MGDVGEVLGMGRAVLQAQGAASKLCLSTRKAYGQIIGLGRHDTCRRLQ